MTSVYYPAHVFVLFRRLMNVVSTIGAGQCLAGGGSAAGGGALVEKTKVDLKRDLLRGLKNDDRRTWSHTLRAVEDEFGAGRSTLDLPKWFPSPSSWTLPSLFAFQMQKSNLQPQVDPEPDRGDERKHEKRSDQEKRKGGGEEEKEGKEQSKRTQESKSEDDKPSPKNKPMHKSKHKELEIPFYDPPNRSDDTIHRLLANPALCDPIRTPRYPIVLCHGLYGFDSRGPTSWPSLRMHYWSNVLRVLRGKVGAEVVVVGVPGTGSIPSRALGLHTQLLRHTRGRGVNFLAHSMGGLDCRHLITHVRPRREEYVPLSLTSVCTPHRGSPFMDWCATNIGIGKLRQQEKELKEELRRSSKREEMEMGDDEPDEEDYYHYHRSTPSSSSDSASHSSTSSASFSSPSSPSSASSTLSLSSLTSSLPSVLLSLFDSPAYSALTSHYLQTIFNPSTPDSPDVKYWSVASRMGKESVGVWHPFWLPKGVLDGWEDEERKRVWEGWLRERGLGDSIGEAGELDVMKDLLRREVEETGSVPVWADERMWGNDGLVTVQSAKWGELLGIVEGADHWEMRGARGIEFGVDLPAIPAIGLGEEPHPSVLGRGERGQTVVAESDPAETSSAQRQTGGDGWGFGDWTRFVGAWKASGEGKKVLDSEKEGDAKVETRTTFESGRGDDSGKEKVRTTVEASMGDKPSVGDRPKGRDEESALKASADNISVVFDWLIDKAPGHGSKGGEGGDGVMAVKETKEVKGGEVRGELEVEVKDGSRDEDNESTLRDKGTNTSMYRVGVSAPSSSSSPASSSSNSSSTQGAPTKPSKPKNELATRQDLERFYISLARKMYDEGL